jgi:hypothetical protein
LETKLDKYEKSFNSFKGQSSKKTPTGTRDLILGE